jgi:Helix-turn-helix domain
MFEIGDSLREARVRQGLDHTEVEFATKIRAKYIRALEDEEFDVLPGDTYIKGFLRVYADYLGLDGQIYVDEYASRFVVSGQHEETPLRRPPRRGRDRGVERRVVLLGLLGIALLAGLVIVAWKFGGQNSPTPPVVRQDTSGATARATPPSGLRLKGIGAGTYVVVRRSTRHGKLLLQGTVASGRIEEIAGQRFYLFARRPARLRVHLAGKPVALPARMNLRVVITPRSTTRVGG